MANAAKHPIPLERLREINRELRALNDAVRLCDKGEQCGQDVSQFREVIETLRDRLTRYKQQFYPNE